MNTILKQTNYEVGSLSNYVPSLVFMAIENPFMGKLDQFCFEKCYENDFIDLDQAKTNIGTPYTKLSDLQIDQTQLLVRVIQ